MGTSPREGSGNPLPYSCLENPQDRGAWRATVHRVAKSDTTERLTLTHAHSCISQRPWQQAGKSVRPRAGPQPRAESRSRTPGRPGVSSRSSPPGALLTAQRRAAPRPPWLLLPTATPAFLSLVSCSSFLTPALAASSLFGLFLKGPQASQRTPPQALASRQAEFKVTFLRESQVAERHRLPAPRLRGPSMTQNRTSQALPPARTGKATLRNSRGAGDSAAGRECRHTWS